LISRRRQPSEALPQTGSVPTGARPAQHSGTEGGRVEQPLTPGHRRVAHLWSDGLGTLGTRALQIILVIILVAGICIGISALSVVVIPVMISTILASALWPLVRLLRQKMSALLTAWTVLIGAFVVLGGIITGIVATVVHEWDGLAKKAVEGFEQLRTWAEHLPFTITQDQIDEALSKASQVVTSPSVGAGALSGLSTVGEFFTGLVLGLVVMFFFLKDGDKIWQFFVSWVPERHRATWQKAGSRARDSFGGYARGTTIVAAVDALGIGLVMLFCGVPLAFPLAILVFLGAYIPMVGATVAGILCVLVTLVSSGFWPAIIVLIGTVVVQQLEGHLLQPVVMGSTLHLHGLVILLGLAGGTVLGGIVGAIISVPLIAAAWAMVKVVSDREGSLDDPEARKRHKRIRKQAKRRLKQARQA
jgi:predicted PurR-regulated permease PerM